MFLFDQAEAAVEDLNEKEYGGRKIFVGRAQKKAERQAELRRKHDQMKVERLTKYQVRNVTVFYL